MKILLIGCLILWISCKPKHNHSDHVHMDDKTEKSVEDSIRSDTSHVHIYACPMHAEVIGKAGDKCSKCGMLLKHKM